MGLVLWNVMYDEVLRLKLPVIVAIVGFANDITASYTCEILII